MNKNFLEIFYLTAQTMVVVGFSVGLVLYLFHLLRIKILATPKLKHDYLYKKHTRMLKSVNVFLAIGITGVINLWPRDEPGLYELEFLTVLGVGLLVGAAHIYLSFLFINVYFAKSLAERLRSLRYEPRINPATGNAMKLLTEEEEDKYLDEGMQAEEDVFSVDYDVWIDEQTGDTHIERYTGVMRARVCGNCHFQTLRLIKEERVTAEEVGEQPSSDVQYVKQYYHCSYCTREEEEVTSMIKKEEGDEDASPQSALLSRFQKGVTAVKIEIHHEDKSEMYDFQGLPQAQQFIAKYQADLLRERSHSKKSEIAQKESEEEEDLS